jgi:hypothetical protein
MIRAIPVHVLAKNFEKTWGFRTNCQISAVYRVEISMAPQPLAGVERVKVTAFLDTPMSSTDN